MKKYFLIAKNAVREGVVYKIEMFSFLFSQLLVFTSYLFLWTSVFNESSTIGSYNLGELVAYYLVAQFILLAIKNNEIAWMVGDEIRLGSFNIFLTQPLDYAKYILFYSLGKSLYNTLVFSCVFAIIFFFLGQHFNIEWSLINFFYFLISITLSFFIYFHLSYIIGLSSFWLGLIQGVNFSFWSISSVLDGSIIPLDLLPDYVQRINNFLPFKYVVFVPISILSGKIPASFDIFLIPFLWIIFLFSISKIIFKRGTKKYEGFGI